MPASAHVFLMCPPEYFNVAYIINPWMHGNLRRIDNALAKQQWRSLYDVLTDHATVRLVLPQPGSPDMVFTANAGLVKGRKFIVSRFRYPERQGEEPYFADWFMDRGYEVSLMPRDLPFEGAGDALFDRGSDVLWMAHGHRSISGARDVLFERLGLDVVTLKLVDQRFYHLDTCFCPLEGGYVMYYPPAFDAESQAVITKRIPADKAEIMHRSTEQLRTSGIMDRVIKVGDPLPRFALPNAYGQEVRSADLLAGGPLVLTFFRGSW